MKTCWHFGMNAYKKTHTKSRLFTHPPHPHLCVPDSRYRLFVPFCYLPHIIFLSPWHTPLDTPECQTGQTDWLHVPMCICVPERHCDYSLCYVSCCAAILSPSLAPLHSFCFHLCLCAFVMAAVAHWGHGVLGGQPDGAADLWCGVD